MDWTGPCVVACMINKQLTPCKKISSHTSKAGTAHCCTSQVHCKIAITQEPCATSAQVCLLVCNLVLVHLLNKQVSLAHVVLPNMDLAVGNSNMDIFYCPHQVINKALAVPTYNIDKRVCSCGAIVNCNLQCNSKDTDNIQISIVRNGTFKYCTSAALHTI